MTSLATIKFKSKTMAAENRIIRFESYDFDIMAKFLKRPYENDDSTDRTLNSNLPSKIVPLSPHAYVASNTRKWNALPTKWRIFSRQLQQGMHLKANGAKKLFDTVVRKVHTWRGKQKCDDKTECTRTPAPHKD